MKPADTDFHMILVAAMEQGLPPESAMVQECVAKHYESVKVYWSPNREQYKGLGMMYEADPQFKQFYENYAPGLTEYLVAGMIVFADTRL